MNHMPASDILAALRPYPGRDRALFRLRPLPGTTVVAYADGFDARGAQKYLVEVLVAGRLLFPAAGPGAVLWGAFAPTWDSKGTDAKRHVLDHLACAPGDTDDDCFAEYTPAQLAWVKAHGDELRAVMFDRYGDD